jgi:LAO/AO transport system kinase
MQQLVEQARGGSIRAASRLISLVENDPARIPELFSGLADWPQPRLVVGLTGAPGVGKSSVADRLIAVYRGRFPERRIGVLAVDPSSPVTGGAVLGDRIRMMSHATDPLVFIRSLSSHGQFGGLTLGVRGSLRVMGLVGCDVVLVETVGVGQSEVEVASVADVVCIVLAPGQGDGVQLLKAGLLEIGDLFIVNKSDCGGAELLERELAAALTLGRGRATRDARTETGGKPMTGETPMTGGTPMLPIFRVSARDNQGFGELVDGIEALHRRLSGERHAARQQSVRREVRAAIVEAARRRIEQALGANGRADERVQRVLAGETTVASLAAELIRSAARDAPQPGT